MSFISGSVTFRRYRVLDCTCNVVDDDFVERITRFAFGRSGVAGTEDLDVGWVTSEHVLDTEMNGEKLAVGRFAAHFALRMDRNSVPAAIRQSYVMLEEQAAREATGRALLSKVQRREAREAARTRADQEARSGAFRRISTAPVLWDLERETVYLASTATTAGERFERLFAETFNARLEPIQAHGEAIRHAHKGPARRELEDAVPAYWVVPPEDLDPSRFQPDEEDRGFLGREFLSWLWFITVHADGVIALLKGADASVSLIRQAHLRCPFQLTGSVTVRHDVPGRAPESLAALTSGKQLQRMGLLVATADGEWQLTLDAPGLNVSGGRLPPIEEDDALQRLEQRFESIADLGQAVDRLYTTFLEKRLSSAWPALHEAMKQWAGASRQAAQNDPQPRLVIA